MSSENDNYIFTKRYIFLNVKTGREIGNLLPSDFGDLIKVFIGPVQWSKNNEKASVLFSYGTKLSIMYVYAKQSNGKMKLIPIKYPDVEEIYKEKTHALLRDTPIDAVDYSAVGPWENNNTANLLDGLQFQHRNKNFVLEDETMAVFIKYKVYLHKNTTEIKNIELFGPMPLSEADALLKKWHFRSEIQ